MRYILPVLFITTAILLFFGLTDSYYQKVLILRAQEKQFDSALSRSVELKKLKGSLLTKYNSFSAEDLGSLRKMLPDNLDNVRLILALDNLARLHGMRIQDVSIDKKAAKQSAGAVEVSSEEAYGSVILSFSTQATYEAFKEFLVDLEKSLRLVDVVELDVSLNENNFDFKVSVQAYWLN